MTRGQVGGLHYRGRWYDIGTPERLNELERLLGDPLAKAPPGHLTYRHA